jgi:hypothetical protein
MRETQCPNVLQFRAGDVLASAVYERARASGVSVSEYLRTIAREKVGMQ